MKHIRSNKNGFTFIEILISIAIFSIIAVAFLTVFTSSVLGIISMGNKSQASAKAQDIIDVVYAVGNLDSLESILTEIVGPDNYEDYSANTEESFNEPNTNGKLIRFFVKESTEMLIQEKVHILTIRVYYNQFKNHVTISSPIIE